MSCRCPVCGTRVCSVSGSKQARCTCFATQMSPKAVWSRAPAKHASESVLVVGEFLCTGVQANTERHKRRKRAKCAHVGDTNNTPPHANRKSGVNFKLPNRARVWQIWEVSRKHITQTGLLHCPEVSSESDIGRVSVWKNPGFIVEIQQLDRITSVLKFCHIEPG